MRGLENDKTESEDMKVAILAGGVGSRLMEETQLTPKPLVEIGGMPILWHIMKIYSHYGYNDFVVLLGYKGNMVRDYFLNYFNHHSDITVDLSDNSVQVHRPNKEPWKVTLVETGGDTLTGGRVLRAKKYLENDTFMLTYGDGVADINIQKLVDFHKAQKSIATLTASFSMEGRFGMLNVDPDAGLIRSFDEKPVDTNSFINGGFMVMEPAIFDYLKDGDATILERAPLENLVKDGQISAYKHTGFWHCMDTMRDKKNLEKLWADHRAPWCVWERDAKRERLRDRPAA